MEKTILKCTNITKQFGKKQVLKDISFNLNKGDILGLVGLNGSGKTTLMKTIVGLCKIDSGNIEINGYNINSNFEKAIEKVGTIIETPDLYMYLSGYDNLKLIANMYRNISKDKTDEIVHITKLNSYIKQKVSKYSLGMRQKLGIAQSLIGSPNLLVLDEPTNGLDPKGIKELRELLISLSNEGTAILISSHNLKELESFCNKICIIKDGKIIETINISETKNSRLSLEDVLLTKQEVK